MLIIYFLLVIVVTIVLLLLGILLGIVISDDEKRKQIVRKINRYRKQTVIYDDNEKTLAEVVNDKKPGGEVYFDTFLDDIQNKKI